MIAGIGAPPGSLEKERMRIAAMRARNEARVDRFLNARVRTIGIDKEGLEAQLSERRNQAQREKEAELSEFQREESIRLLLEQREAENRRLQKEMASQIRKEWDQQMQATATSREAARTEQQKGVDPEVCGSAALQKLTGEDPARAQRLATQKAQTQSWARQQMEENRLRKEAVAQEEQQYHEFLMEVNRTRGEIEQREMAMRKELDAEVKAENRMLWEEKAAKLRQWKERQSQADAEELAHREVFLTEDRAQGFREGGRMVRDGFRGLTDEQRAAIAMANVDKRAAMQQERERQQAEELAWFNEQERARRMADEQAAEREGQARELEEEHKQDLLAQRKELKQKQLVSRHGRFGGIDHSQGIYAGFGKSCR